MKAPWTIPAVALSCIAACSSISESPAGESSAGVQGEVRPSTARHYTLVLGDSYAFGWQPFKDNSDARNFSTGFGTLFVARLNASRPGLRTEEANFACPGETSVTFVEAGCFYLGFGFPLHVRYEGSQLEAGESFLQAHNGQVNPVILALGINDVGFMYNFDCALDRDCVRARLPGVLQELSRNLDRTLRDIRTLVGDAEVLVALEYGSPVDDSFVQMLVDTTAGTVLEVGKRYDAVLVDMRPVIAENECALTFICTEMEDGHPTDLGYRRLSQAFWAASQFSRP